MIVTDKDIALINEVLFKFEAYEMAATKHGECNIGFVKNLIDKTWNSTKEKLSDE